MHTTIDRRWKIRHYKAIYTPPKAYFTPFDAQIALAEGLHARATVIRQQSIYGGGQASVARSQVGIAINQASIEAEQLHDSLLASSRDIAAKIEPLVKDAAGFGQRCQGDQAQQSHDLHDTCLKFLETAKKFKKSLDVLGKAFDHAERVWVEEHSKQDRIVQASTVASR
jgi:hypothetical protein